MREAMLIIHFIGLSMGLGTSFGFMILGIASSKLEPAEAWKFMKTASKLSIMGHIGITLLLISGGYMMTPYWGVLTEMPLLMTKLGLVLLLIILIGVISAAMGKAKRNNTPETMAKIKPVSMLTMLVGITIVVMAVLQFH